MPYITRERQKEIVEHDGVPENPGELNFLITYIVCGYITRQGGMKYGNINEVIGALECAKLEMYRRLAAPYEDKKILENGDVYESSTVSE